MKEEDARASIERRGEWAAREIRMNRKRRLTTGDEGEESETSSANHLDNEFSNECKGVEEFGGELGRRSGWAEAESSFFSSWRRVE